MEIEILERSRYVGRTYILAPSFFILLLPFLSKCVNVYPLAESHAETPSAVERKDWLVIFTVLAVHYYLVLNFTKHILANKYFLNLQESSFKLRENCQFIVFMQNDKKLIKITCDSWATLISCIFSTLLKYDTFQTFCKTLIIYFNIWQDLSWINLLILGLIVSRSKLEINYK